MLPQFIHISNWQNPKFLLCFSRWLTHSHCSFFIVNTFVVNCSHFLLEIFPCLFLLWRVFRRWHYANLESYNLDLRYFDNYFVLLSSSPSMCLFPGSELMDLRLIILWWILLSRYIIWVRKWTQYVVIRNFNNSHVTGKDTIHGIIGATEMETVGNGFVGGRNNSLF